MTWREKRIIIWNIKGKFGNKLEHQINKTYPRFNRIQQGWGIAAQEQSDGSHLLWVTDSTSTMKAIEPNKWKTDQSLDIKFPNGTEV